MWQTGLLRGRAATAVEDTGLLAAGDLRPLAVDRDRRHCSWMGCQDLRVDLFHFSHDPAIERFAPHVPATNSGQPPRVWAIDADHAPLYWFPRDCPRVTAWPRNVHEQIQFRESFSTVAPRVHAIELGWLPILGSAVLYRYRFDGSSFRPWTEASGQWVSDVAVEPIEVERIDDLIGCHVAAGIELRAVPNLWPLRDLAAGGTWDFSIVRFQQALPRPG